MNVIQTEQFLRTARGRASGIRRRGPGLQSAAVLPNYMYNLEFPSKRKKQGINLKATSPSCSKSSKCSNYQSRRARENTLSSAFVTSRSRNCASRSGTKSNTGAGSSALESASGIVLAITNGRGEARSEVGIAALDIRCPHLILCQISDTQTYTNALSKLYLFDPIEILMPDTICDPVTGKGILYRSIMDKFPEAEVTALSRIHFNDTIGLERVKSLCVAEYSSVELYVKQKYYALAATAALLKYVEYTRRLVYATNSMRIEFQGSPNATVIDLESARSLELVQSQSGQRNVSLFGVLDHCSTPMGRKLLRANILQPPCKQRIILERQSAVAELTFNHSLLALVQPILRRFYGADRLLALATTPALQESSVQCAEQNLNYVLLLKNLLDAVPELGGALSTGESDLLRRTRERLENHEFRSMRERILGMIHPEASSVTGYTSSNMQRCFAIKAGINDLLDIARRTYCELIDDMKIMVENLAIKYKLTLCLSCNATLGYHVQAMLPRHVNPNTWEPPSEFIEVRKTKRLCTMTTSTLATLSQQCKIACEELHLMSNVLLCDLLQSIRQHIGCLFQLSADVAELDLVASLAQVSSLKMYVKPTFGSKLELLDSRHPVMEVFGIDGPVPNNVNSSIPCNFSLISGPNMSGKSTYLKQIVLLHIMAQLGCFIPAKKATFRITDFVFCKIAVRDDIESNASTFTLEMKEAQYILRSVTPTSLIVLDELCKGTAIEEGASIAWAVCEQLLNTTAFVFAATHFFYLTKLADIYHNVTNYHFETVNVRGIEDETCRRLTYTHRLKLGITPSDDYGIVLAEFSGLPKTVTEKARRYASERLLAEEITTKSKPWEKKCYEIVLQLYELLETDKYDTERVTLLLEHLVKLEKQQNEKAEFEFHFELDMEKEKETVEERVEERMEERVEETVEETVEKTVEETVEETVEDTAKERLKEKGEGRAKDKEESETRKEIEKEDNESRKDIFETVSSKRSFDVMEGRSRGTVVDVNADSKVARIKKHAYASTSTRSPRNEIFNFKDNSFDLMRKRYYALSDRSSHSIDSLSLYSALSKSDSRSYQFEKRTFQNLAKSNRCESQTDDRFQNTVDSICSAIAETDLSLPSLHDSSSMRKSMSMDRSVSKLYEYCLSDNDFEPMDNVSGINQNVSDVSFADSLTR